MTGILDMRQKLHILQQQASEAEERAESLQREVEKEKLACEQAETEMAPWSSWIQGIEEELDQAQERLATTLCKLEEGRKVANENEQVMKVIEDKAIKDEEMMELHEIHLKEEQYFLLETHRKLDEMIWKLMELDWDLVRTEQLNVAESQGPQADEARPMDQKLTSEVNHFLKEKKYEEKMKILANKLEVAESRAQYAENLTVEMGKVIDDLENKLKSSKEAHFSTQQMLARTLLDLNKL